MTNATFAEELKKALRNMKIGVVESDYPEPERVQSLVRWIVENCAVKCVNDVYEQMSENKVSSPSYMIDLISDLLPFKAGSQVTIDGHKFPVVVDEVIIRENEILFRWTEYDDTNNEVTVRSSGTFNFEDVGKTVFPYRTMLGSPEPAYAIITDVSEVITSQSCLTLNKELSDLNLVFQGIRARRIIGAYKNYAEALKTYESLCKTASSVCAGYVKCPDGSAKYKYHVQIIELGKVEYDEEQGASTIETVKIFFRDINAVNSLNRKDGADH